MRRWMAFGSAAVLAVLLAAGVRWGPRAWSPARAQVTLLYVGAEDCAPCRAWQGIEGKTLRESPEFVELTYREVKSPTSRDVLKDAYWPDDLRRYRDRLGPGAGVPLWLVISGEEVVERGFGLSQWHAAVLPRLRTLLR